LLETLGGSIGVIEFQAELLNSAQGLSGFLARLTDTAISALDPDRHLAKVHSGAIGDKAHLTQKLRGLAQAERELGDLVACIDSGINELTETGDGETGAKGETPSPQGALADRSNATEGPG